MIDRIIEKAILDKLFKGKAILIFGARQVGKTTLINKIAGEINEQTLVLNGDEPDVRELLSNATSRKLKAYFGNNKLVIIDEAQGIKDIGITLKLISDQLKDIQIVATGSSAFELADKTAESLTGRKYEFKLYPFSFGELVAQYGLLEEKRVLEHRMIFGYYPEIVNNEILAKEHLKLIAGSYLYKDILMLGKINKTFLLEKILRALALQVGNEISFNEIGNMVQAKGETVEKYIDLLEKAYIIFRLPAFSRNVRNEIKKGKKIYFCDNGIRNAIIGSFNPIEKRTDTGALWENFVVSERMKFLRHSGIDTTMYFWRTTQQQEIDLIEEAESMLSAYEIKWQKRKVRFSRTFLNAYPDCKMHIIMKDNVEDFLLFNT